MSFESIYNLLDYRFNVYNFDDGHRLPHALIVAGHAYSALRDFPQLTAKQKDAILLSCILHDVNDHKFIHNNRDELDLALLLSEEVSEDVIELTMVMIDYISCSKNGDSIISPTWMLIPRYADRLEAMGKMGLCRAMIYANHVGRPFIDRTTDRAHTEEELDIIASKDRYLEYTEGKRDSPTTIDHLYDKVLHLDVPDWLNCPTLSSIAKERREWLRKYILDYFNAS